MNILLVIIQVLMSVLIPLGVLWAEPRSRSIRAISPVVVCYAVGMAFGNQPWVAFSNTAALTLCNITVALAIPLLLFSVNIAAWLRLARRTVLSFIFCIIAVMVSGTFAYFIFRGSLMESEKIAGMLVGVYTGGTPNMAAISTALKVKPETFILVNAADMFVSFAYLFFILALAARLLDRLFPQLTPAAEAQGGSAESPPPLNAATVTLPPLKSIVLGLLLTLIIVTFGFVLSRLFPGSDHDSSAILLITTLGVFASLNSQVRNWEGTQDMGQFLLLVFCVSMGYTTSFSKLFTAPPELLLFTAVALFGAVALHFFLGILFRIDRNTIIITSAAAVFGPHMVGPVALNLKSREILFSGLASGLVGYAVANYLGVGLAWLLGKL